MAASAATKSTALTVRTESVPISVWSQPPKRLTNSLRDPNLKPGKLRKVGPSLKRVADKTTAEWIAYWTEKPKRFRASTKMPQFFGLTNLEDHLGAQLSGLEIRSIAKFLVSQSTPQSESKTLMSPAEGYTPDAERGKVAFAERGCLACHSHDGDEFKGASATFGPEPHEDWSQAANRRRWLQLALHLDSRPRAASSPHEDAKPVPRPRRGR